MGGFILGNQNIYLSKMMKMLIPICTMLPIVIPLVTGLSLQTQKTSGGNLGPLVEEAELKRELENLVKNLSDQNQLELLETIMGRGHDESTEFDLITAELKDMGMDEEDIEDLKQLSELMYEFLKQIPSLVTKLQLVEEYDLLDNVQLYLLGLPNKLGPLGYVALQYVLEELNDTDGEIVDIKVESLQPSETTSSAAQSTEVPSFRRKRSSPLEQVMRLRRAM